MQRTLKRELKVPEIVKREAIVDVIAWVGFSDLPGVIQSPFYLWFGTHSRPLYWGCRGVQKCASRGGHLGLEKKR